MTREGAILGLYICCELGGSEVGRSVQCGDENEKMGKLQKVSICPELMNFGIIRHIAFAEIMTEEQAELIGRTFRHFKMRLSPTAIRLADERSKELLHGKSRKSPRNLYRLDGFAKDSETLEEKRK